MPFIRSLASKHCTYIILVILSLSEIIPTCSHYIKKKLVYVVIMASFSRQPFSYLKYTKSNMHLSCNIRLVLNAKYL